MKPWYQLDEKERIKEIYSKYTIKDFWDWWSDDKSLWMEIRTVDWKFAKEIGKRFSLKYSQTGVFVNSATHLKNVIAYARDKNTIWFGVQPRKYGVTKWGSKGISGGDNYVDSIKFIFIDIDRKVKEAPATSEELKQCDIVSEAILDIFRKHDWAKSYAKIGSGNGVQLLIKLDVAIKIPNVEYIEGKDLNGKPVYSYLTNANFDKAKKMLYETIGQHMILYIKKYVKDNNLDNVEIDKAGFRMAQVGALHCTKNFKYGSFRWRGILDMKSGVNSGLSDYIFQMSESMSSIKTKDIGGYTKVDIFKGKRLTLGNLKKHKLIKFMLENDLPAGERNNKLWFQVKCLIRDYGIDVNSKEFRALHKELEMKHGSLPANIPDENRFQFDINIVNSWFIDNLVPPIYDLWPHKTLKKPILDILEWSELDIVKGDDFSELDIKKNMFSFKKYIRKVLEEEDDDEYDAACNKVLRTRKIQSLFKKFVKDCIATYGVKATKYYYEFLFDRYFNYQ